MVLDVKGQERDHPPSRIACEKIRTHICIVSVYMNSSTALGFIIRVGA